MKKILVVDDLEINHVLLVYYFELFSSGVHITKAYNGREALRIIEYCKEYDLIIMDVNMPVMDGCEATQKIRQTWPEAHIVLHSDGDDVYYMYKKFHFNDVLEKPLTQERFVKFVEKYELLSATFCMLNDTV